MGHVLGTSINKDIKGYVEYVKNIKYYTSRNSPLPNLNARSYSEDITSRWQRYIYNNKYLYGASSVDGLLCRGDIINVIAN